MANTRGELGSPLVAEINGTPKAVPADAELLLRTSHERQGSVPSEAAASEVICTGAHR